MTGGSIFKYPLIGVLILCHLASTAAGGTLLVRCQGADGHVAIEVSHPSACHENADSRTHPPITHIHGLQPQEKHCQDDPATAPLITRKPERSQTPEPITQVLLCVFNTPRPLNQPRPTPPTNLQLSDSARSLAASIILLI